MLKRTQSFVFLDLSIFFLTNFSSLKKVLISQLNIRAEKQTELQLKENLKSE